MKAVRVWEFPIRVMHWTNFLSIVGLSLTGIYIHWPFLSPNMPLTWTFGYGPMGLARMIHLICGIALSCGLAGRFLWAPIFGNKYSSLKEFFPFATSGGRKRLTEGLRYYLFLSRQPPHYLGHHAIAAFTYFLIFCLMAFQVLTGFALWSQMDPSGTVFSLTGWVFSFASNGYVRLAHYFALFLFLTFAMAHIYAMWIADLSEKNGGAGSMFNGYKYEE